MGVESSPLQTRFKNLERKLERESQKRIISTSSELGLGLGLLHNFWAVLHPQGYESKNSMKGIQTKAFFQVPDDQLFA